MPLTITAEEKERLIESSLQTMREWQRPIIIETNITITVGLISMLQLALRHPATAERPTTAIVERFTRNLIEGLDPTHGDFYLFLMLGFNPDFDE
jgi:hypothetical protein